MDDSNQSVTLQKIPRTKNRWLRLTKYLVVSTIISYGIYYFMSQMELDYLKSLNNGRATMAFIMLSIMPARAWFWFWFFGIVIPALWGDWHDFRWQSFPKKVNGVNGISGRGDG